MSSSKFRQKALAHLHEVRSSPDRSGVREPVDAPAILIWWTDELRLEVIDVPNDAGSRSIGCDDERVTPFAPGGVLVIADRAKHPAVDSTFLDDAEAMIDGRT